MELMDALNTGGNHEPLQRHYNIQRKIMNKRYPFQVNIMYIQKNKSNNSSQIVVKL